MTSSKIFLYFCLSFIGGIFISSMLGFLTGSEIYILLPGFILGILLILVFWKYKKLSVIGFCILFLVLGVWKHQLVELKIINNELKQFNDLEEIITLEGIIVIEPDVRETNSKLTIKVEKLILENDYRKINSKALITTYRYPEYEYGDKLKITGKLLTPIELSDFNYKDYLLKDGIYSVMYYPEIELLKKNQGNFFLAKIFNFKNNLRESIYKNLPPAQGSILGAMILGDKRKLSQDLQLKLNIAGVRHITAISGLHITILTAILVSFLLWLGFWRQQSFYFTVILITFFIIMTGLQPSAIRAGIMGGLFLLGQYLGRISISSRAIVFAASIMLFKNPLLLKLDIGFQLSFLAIIGIIYFLPIFKNWLRFIPWENPKSILAMTFSAYFFTLPVLIYNFGYVSFVSPITNLLIMPFLYWIMIFGFIFALLGTFSQTLGWILSFLIWVLLTYLIKIVDWFSVMPIAYKTIGNIHWIWLVPSYLILIYIAFRFNKKQGFIISKI